MGKMKDFLMDMHETTLRIECPECLGAGTVEVEFARPHNFNRDVGYLDTRTEVCETCEGDGEIDQLCERCDEPVTKVRCNENGQYVVNSKDHKLCEECSI